MELTALQGAHLEADWLIPIKSSKNDLLFQLYIKKTKKNNYLHIQLGHHCFIEFFRVKMCRSSPPVALRHVDFHDKLNLGTHYSWDTSKCVLHVI